MMNISGGMIDKMRTRFPGFLSPFAVSIFEWLQSNIMWSARDGARTQVYLAASTEVFEKNIRGKYFHPGEWMLVAGI